MSYQIFIHVRIFFSIFSVIELDNVRDCSMTDDGISSSDSCRCLSLRYKCSVNNVVDIVVNINISVEYERPPCRIPLKENIDLNEYMYNGESESMCG